MIARLYVQIPFVFDVPIDDSFDALQFEHGHYTINFYPPQRTGEQIQQADKLLVNGMETVKADLLWIDFIADEFDRSRTTRCDPPYEIINEVLGEFIERVRYVTNSPNIKPVFIPEARWEVSYLNDDGTILPADTQLTSTRGAVVRTYNWNILNNDTWSKIESLPDAWVPPRWKSLILDARNLLPEIGPCLVLTATALEVMIADVLNVLSLELDDKNNVLWLWLNNRGLSKKPVSREQFDVLLNYFTGRSLKEDNDLWESLVKIQNSRNNFVHEGRALINKEEEVDISQAVFFLEQAEKIIAFVRDSLPDPLKWPTFEHDYNLRIIDSLSSQGK